MSNGWSRLGLATADESANHKPGPLSELRRLVSVDVKDQRCGVDVEDCRCRVDVEDGLLVQIGRGGCVWRDETGQQRDGGSECGGKQFDGMAFG